MSNLRIFDGALAGAVGGIWAGVVTYAGFLLAGLPFPPFSLFDWEAHVLPGGVLDLTVDASIKLVNALHLGPTAAAAKGVEHALAVVQFIALAAVLGILVALWSRHGRGPGRGAGLVLGALLGVGFAAIGWSLGFAVSPAWSLAWLAVGFMAWGWLLGAWSSQVFARNREVAGTEAAASRRRFLYWSAVVGVAAGVVLLLSGAVRRLFAGQTSFEKAAPDGAAEIVPLLPTSGPAASPPRAALAARLPPAPGTRAEITPTAQFYRVDIDSAPPAGDAASWRLTISGLVAKRLSLSLDDLRAMPAITEAITLSCISNPVGGDLISTGFYTGVPLREILAMARPMASAAALNMACADGYHESMDTQTAMDERTLLVYDLNGDALPAEHGFPARIYIPDRYGMKQPKWITSIELARKSVPGFWVKRGWSREALVRTTSVVDPPPGSEEVSAAGTVTVGGIAYSGDKGISKVEVQVDGGPWGEAELRVPPLSPLTWVQWRLETSITPGSHTFAVRAYDGAGRLQITAAQDSYPAGATGVFSRTVHFARRVARRLPRRLDLGARARS
jgi:DMSO/TMAO reductase YedYZ molybdopterin-dependent catalytic subunit